MLRKDRRIITDFSKLSSTDNVINPGSSHTHVGTIFGYNYSTREIKEICVCGKSRIVDIETRETISDWGDPPPSNND